LQLGQRVAQAVVLVGFHRIQAGEHLRLDFLEAGQASVAGAVARVMVSPTLACFEFLDAGDDEAHLAGGKLGARQDLGVNTPTCSHR
jgi:hypothetical protein